MGSSSSKAERKLLQEQLQELRYTCNEFYHSTDLGKMYDYLISNEEAIKKITDSKLPEAGLVLRYDQTIRNLVTSIKIGENLKFQLSIIEATFFRNLDTDRVDIESLNTKQLYDHIIYLRGIWKEKIAAQKLKSGKKKLKNAIKKIKGGKDQLRL